VHRCDAVHPVRRRTGTFGSPGRSRSASCRPPGDALPTRDADVARRVLAADLELLADLNQQISQAEEEPTALVPASPPRTLTSVPGWGVVPTAAYGAAVFRPPQDNHRTPVRADQA